MIPRRAQYLLRFDDLCPTMAFRRWNPFEQLIREFGIQPILAVIPDNQDPELAVEKAAPDFWERMRLMEAAGAAIALHGYTHLCNSSGRSLMPLNRLSEFAGVPKETQLDWIRKGLGILRNHGLNPRLWVAPRHGFDLNTCAALQAEGIFHISDGFARIPCTRAGMTSIPQQLWSPVVKSRGLWTICIHSNSSLGEDVVQLRDCLRDQARQFTSFDRVIKVYPARPLGIKESLYETAALWRLILSHRTKRCLHLPW